MNTAIRARRAAAVALLSCATAARAATPPGSLQPFPPGLAATYLRAAWTTEAGLPQNTVTTIVQSRDGYLWLGTLGGLVRFDGVRFTLYTVATTPALRSNRIRALAEDREGTLWIGTEVGGLTCLRDGTFHAFPANDRLPGEFVQEILPFSDGVVWVGTASGLARIQGTRAENRTPGARLPSPNVQALAPDGEGGLWIGTLRGLVRLHESGQATTYTDADGLPSPHVRALHPDGPALWIGTDRGPARFENGTFVAVPSGEGRTLGRTSAFARGKDGALWAGVEASGVLKLERERFVVPAGMELLPERIESLLVDREGTLWIGRERSGLERWRRRGIAVLPMPDGLGGKSTLPILEDGRGTVWVGSYCGGVTGYGSDGRVVRHLKPDGVAQWCMTSLHEDHNGTVWIGTEGGGPYALADERLIPHPAADHFRSIRIGAMYEDRERRLWVGTDHGLHRLERDQHVVYRTGEGLVHDDVTVLMEDKAGALWVGTRGGLSRLHHGRFTNYTPANGLSHAVVRDIYEDVDGVLWIGTYGGGLNRLESGRFTHYTMQTGFPDDVVSRILVDSDDRFWMSGNRGLFRVARRELNDFAAGRTRGVTGVMYGVADGMPHSETQGGAQPAGWKTRDGRLWFPTLAGVAVVDPRILANDLPPPVTIEQVLVDHEPAETHAGLELGPGEHSLEIRYTALSLAAPEKVRFRYRLDGFELAWVEAGPRRTAYYTNLKPGRYQFHVTAANEDGTWNHDGASMELEQRPHFYQTAWFAVTAVLALLAAGLGAYRLRVRQLMRRTRELEQRVDDRTAEVVAQRNELARVNAQLGRSNDDMGAVLDRLRAAALVLDANGVVAFLNRAARQLLDRDGVAGVGRPWDDLVPLSGEDRAKVAAAREAPAAARTKVPVKWDRDGRRFWMEIEAHDDPLDRTRHILFLYDVTEAYDLRRLLDEKAHFHGLVGEGRGMQVVFKQVRDLAPLDTTVLIEGETGTGKELVAHAVHQLSPRRNRPFIPVNCAGLTESLLVSQLFGHRRGAFTGAVADHLGLFEAATGGTVFLDEIGDIPPAVQTALLRVLQEKEITRLGESKPRKVDVRIVAATHRDLVQAVTAGTFRQDLLYRIRVARVAVPPLRERREDIPRLVEWFLGQARTATGRAVEHISTDAMQKLVEHPWPGNVRELKSAIESAVIGCEGSVLQPAHLPPEITGPAAEQAPDHDEERRIREALARTRGNRAATAKLLGIGRTTLYRRLRELRIENPK